MLADQTHHFQLAWGEAGPARGGALALAATPGGISDRLIRGELPALGPRGRKFVRAEGLSGAGNRSFVGALLDGKADVAEARALYVGRRPEPYRLLVTLLFRSKSRQQLQTIDEPELVARLSRQGEGFVG